MGTDGNQPQDLTASPPFVHLQAPHVQAGKQALANFLKELDREGRRK
jgi:hypothetical protein